MPKHERESPRSRCIMEPCVCVCMWLCAAKQLEGTSFSQQKPTAPTRRLADWKLQTHPKTQRTADGVANAQARDAQNPRNLRSLPSLPSLGAINCEEIIRTNVKRIVKPKIENSRNNFKIIYRSTGRTGGLTDWPRGRGWWFLVEWFERLLSLLA